MGDLQNIIHTKNTYIEYIDMGWLYGKKPTTKIRTVGIFVVGILPNSFVGILVLMVTLVGIFV